MNRSPAHPLHPADSRVLAPEGTFLAWVRTSLGLLALMAVGAGTVVSDLTRWD